MPHASSAARASRSPSTSWARSGDSTAWRTRRPSRAAISCSRPRRWSWCGSSRARSSTTWRHASRRCARARATAASTSIPSRATPTVRTAPSVGTSGRSSKRRRPVADPWSPTAEQRAAVEIAGSAAVRAGAGSGKTAVLARRFVHLLRSGGPVAEVGQILAITFTEKATAEMTRKIRQVIAEEVESADAAARAHWGRVRRDLLGAQISTIHAFSARVLRENPLEVGVDPRAVVLDEHESRSYVESTVEVALLAHLRAGDGAARELVLRAGLAGGPSGGAVGLVADFLARLGRTGRDGAWLVAATARQAERAPEASEALRAAVARLVATIDARLAQAGRGRGAQALAEAWPAWKERLRRLGPETPLEEFLELRLLRALLARASLASAVEAELAVQPGGRLQGTLAEAYGMLRALPENEHLARLIAAVGDALRARKREDAVLTFDDLIGETRAVLAGDSAVRERYARRFRAILVDEFQDTDRVQAEIVRLLAAGTPAPLVFVVGDEKQSIYRFRGADVSVFQDMRAELGCELPLGTNFRSVPAVLDFVNALAAAILQVPPGGSPTHWTRFDEGQRLLPHRGLRAGGAAVREEALSLVEAGPVGRAAARRHLEDRRRERVHEVEDRRDGAEVGSQGQLAAELRAHVLEHGDVGPAEAVDRLLLVAHHEHEGRGGARRQQPHDLGLHAVGVLELVDQDGAEAAGVALAHGGVPRQDGARLADEIVEGEDGVLALAGAERIADGGDQAGEALVLRQRVQHAVRLGERPHEAPARLHRELRLHGARERRPGQEPAQPAQRDEVLERRLGSDVPEPLLPGRPRLGERLGALSPARLREARLDRRDQARRGGAQRRRGLGRPFRLPRRRRHQPGAVAAGAAEPGEEVRDEPDGAAVAPAGDPLAQHELARRGVAGAQVRQQRGLHRALDVGPALVLVEHDGARIDSGLERVLAQDASGEGVDGGDLRPQEVAPHARPVRTGRRVRRPELLGDHFADLARHLRRRLLGDRDGEDLAHLRHRTVRAEQVHEAEIGRAHV